MHEITAMSVFLYSDHLIRPVNQLTTVVKTRGLRETRHVDRYNDHIRKQRAPIVAE